MKVENRFKDIDVQDAYARGVHLVHKFGFDLLEIDPAIHTRVPSALSQKLKLGPAIGLWRGIHSHGGESPFQDTWPIQGFFLAGQEWMARYREILWMKGVR